MKYQVIFSLEVEADSFEEAAVGAYAHVLSINEGLTSIVKDVSTEETREIVLGVELDKAAELGMVN